MSYVCKCVWCYVLFVWHISGSILTVCSCVTGEAGFLQTAVYDLHQIGDVYTGEKGFVRVINYCRSDCDC